MAKNEFLPAVNFINILVQVTASETDGWSDPRGNAQMSITLPSNQCGADVLDLNKIMPALVTMARNNFFDVIAQKPKQIDLGV
jgi:hypothetical protein